MSPNPEAPLKTRKTNLKKVVSRPKNPLKLALKAAQKAGFFVDEEALKKLDLVAVAYSAVEREWFPTDEAYEAEKEVERRAEDVMARLAEFGIPAKGYPADRYFLAKLLVDKPKLVLNLVDTVKGRDGLQTSVPAALELTDIPYTGAGMNGMVIGNDRTLFKQLLDTNDIPTPDYQFISRKGKKVDADLGLPLIVKLNESGGSVGIDNQAVKESLEEAQQKVSDLIGEYKIPVIVEQFVDGDEITVAVFDDGQRQHVYQGKKLFRKKQDGKHFFTSLESYRDPKSYRYEKVKNEELAARIESLTKRAFNILHNRDYAKFDVRVDQETGEAYFTDGNPNTAFGPHIGLPFTEVLDLHGVPFDAVLISLLSKHAKKIEE